MQKHYRQGDVIVIESGPVPPTATARDRCVLALGEKTGHMHQIVEGARLWEGRDGARFVEVLGETATLTHDEHGPIELVGPGVYRIGIQREYAPEGIRSVED